MNQRLWQTAVERAGRLAAPLALDELPDAELLGRFTAARDEPAFAALVRRHGPLVWGVCRGLSATEADAEDAFQATFLALFRSAAKVRQANALGAWLHRVAGRVCRNGLRTRARRTKHERAAAVAEAACPVAEAAWDRWHDAVHAEIDRLPDTLRVPFVLCVLQGVRQAEAARRLGWKLGTVSGRVCKAKQALGDAIARRGLTGAAGLAAVAGGGMLAAPLSAALVAKGTVVVRPAVGPGAVSATVHELARGATGGVMSKTKLLAAAVLVGGLTFASLGTQYTGTAEAQPGASGASAGGGPAGRPPEGGPGGAPGARGGGGSGKAGPGMSGGGGGGFGSMAGPRVEYKFQARPGGSDQFKGLLTQLGNDGWEYVGVVPGQDELIFKRAQRPGGIGGGMMGPGGFDPRGGGGGGFGGMPGGGFGGGAFPGGGGFGGALGGGGPAPKGGDGGPGGPGGPRGPGPGGPGGAGGPGPGGPGGLGVPGGGEGVGLPGMAPPMSGGNKPADSIELRMGETVRHRLGRTVERVHVRDPKVAEVSLDPTDARRVIIKSLTGGGTQVELTGDDGKTVRLTVRIR